VAIADGQGAVYERYRYDPYGKVRIWNQNNTELVDGGVPYSGLKNEIMFQGRERDAETGLYCYRNRIYHPTLGRFLQCAPVEHVHGMSLYDYCGSGGLAGPPAVVESRVFHSAANVGCERRRKCAQDWRVGCL
jgi:RHS repeat-associated protein